MSDIKRASDAYALMERERIGVLPADEPRNDWCGYMTRKRHKRKGIDSWNAYAPTPVEAIEAVWAKFQAEAGQSA